MSAHVMLMKSNGRRKLRRLLRLLVGPTPAVRNYGFEPVLGF
jgi:hypothetical protein